ncbi:HK97-gp10 family putative phage morphogenesis protein [Streptomyces apocyni]|uniref:HK97-gp10 family putative phage morphogenesis protein n=1 Tax=Streptomyces apocyni TaxID=2654677 RepID=UPI0012EAE68D|nr:HK97-gp10 family putative phage morphogenesis protein [Streptomyces apocyni]
MARRRARVEVIGIDRLRRRLAEVLPQLKEAAQTTVREAGEAMERDVSRSVRIDSGNLKRSVKATYEKDGLQTSVGWRDQDDLYAVFHERGTRRTPANPTLIPALEREGSELVARLRAEVRRELR